MKRKLMHALLALPILTVILGGCVVYPAGGGYHGHSHYWHDRDRW